MEIATAQNRRKKPHGKNNTKEKKTVALITTKGYCLKYICWARKDTLRFKKKDDSGKDFPQGFWEDEYRASYETAKYAPNLTQEDRYRLILDALDRAKEAGIIIEKMTL